jgi:hypothetical protein
VPSQDDVVAIPTDEIYQTASASILLAVPGDVGLIASVSSLIDDPQPNTSTSPGSQRASPARIAWCTPVQPADVLLELGQPRPWTSRPRPRRLRGRGSPIRTRPVRRSPQRRCADLDQVSVAPVARRRHHAHQRPGVIARAVSASAA